MQRLRSLIGVSITARNLAGRSRDPTLCRAETLRRWVRQAEVDHGQRAGLTTSERERLKQLEREVRELKRANETLRKTSAFFAQAELDRKAK